MRIFISHSSHDAKIATAVCSTLEASGYSCFIAPRDIKAGREYAEEIINGIDGSDILLLLLSVKSNQSPHVLREVERAGSRRIPIMVYKLEEVALTKSLEYFLMTNQWIDGTDDFHCSKVLEAFKNLPDMSKQPVKKQQDAVTGQAAQKQKHFATDRAKQSQTQSKENTGKSVKQPKAADKQNKPPKEKSSSGKKIALAILLFLLICGVIFGVTSMMGGTKGTVFKGVVLNYWTTVIDPYKDADLEARVRGSNLWCDSNIRIWLNSERENVVYEDQAPAASAMSEKKNGYSNEAGCEGYDIRPAVCVDRQALLKLLSAKK